MLLSVADMVLLRILRWCQYAGRADMALLCPQTDLAVLTAAGLLKQRQGDGVLSLTGKGHQLLEEVYGDIPPKTAQTYHAAAISRRIRLAKLMLTAYRAGLSVFSAQPEELAEPPAFFLPAVARGRGRNPWGNTRIAAIAALDGLLCNIHYVCPGIGKLLLSDELGAFSNNTACLPQKETVLVFAGDTYAGILAELEETGQEAAGRLVSYGEAYRRSPLPVVLLSCDDTGAAQLRIMAKPDYRGVLTRAALRSQYQPPPEGGGCDALFDGAPFYLAVDMDLRRLDAACLRQKACGGKKPALAALEGQAETVLYARYRDTGLARVFTLTADTLAEVLGPAHPNPADAVFCSPKGDVIHAPLIQTAGTAGKGRRKK